MNIKIRKASGKVEDFNPNKLKESLVKSGADIYQAVEIVDKITSEIKPYASTKKIYRLARKYLRQIDQTSPLRYSLKNALLRLGPTGFPFEKYIGKLIGQYGYDVKVGLFLDGKCVRHEVDVFAVKDDEVAVVECKYRNNSESASDVKTAMYVHSRFRDLHDTIRHQYPGREFTGWLVTNTRFTIDAVQYAECSGLKVTSWKYPKKDSLEKMIEDKSLYPVTVLSGLNSGQIRKLFEQNIILMKDLASLKTQKIRKILLITEKTATSLKEQAEKLCFC